MTKQVYRWSKSATVPTFLHLSCFLSLLFVLMGGGEKKEKDTY